MVHGACRLRRAARARCRQHGFRAAGHDTTGTAGVHGVAVVFDTGPSAVAIEFCAKATDDLSGITRIDQFANCATPGAGCENYSGTIVPGGLLSADDCAEVVLPRFSAYGYWNLRIYLLDQAGNRRSYVNPASASPGDLDLWCPLGFRTAQAANFSRYSTGVR